MPYWYHSLHERYQSYIVRVSPDELDIIAPEAWDDIHSAVKSMGNFPKDLRIFGEIQNIVTVNDVDHRRLRRLISHAFSEKALREQEQILLFHIRKFVNIISEKIPSPLEPAQINVTDHFMFLVFDIVSDLSFGSSFGCQDNSQYHPWVANLMGTLQMVLLISVTQRFPPLSRLLRYMVPKDKREARKRHVAWTAEKVDSRLNLETSRPDFLTYITRNNDEPEKGGMTREEVYQNAAAFMSAGGETTAAHLTATTYFLLADPKYKERLTHDIRSSFSSAEEINGQTIIDRLPFLKAIIDETFRLYPVALGGVARVSPPSGAMVAGHFIPANTGVTMNGYALGHSNLNFSDPEDFRPERWMDDGGEGEGKDERSKDRLDAVQPFGVGVRNCIGKK